MTGYFAFSTEDNYKLTGHGVPTAGDGHHGGGELLPCAGCRADDGEAVQGRGVAERRAAGGDAVTMRSGSGSLAGTGQSWANRFELDGKPATVAGVLPESFDFGAAFSPGAKVDITDAAWSWTTSVIEGNTIAIVGRLKPGVTLEQARAEAKTLFPQFYWGKRFADSKGQYSAYPVFLKEYVSGKLRRSLDRAVVRGGTDPADRVRESFEPAAGTCCGA